jgi:DNA polymerase (family 10)
VADAVRYGTVLLFATGSATHVEALRERAGRYGFSLAADGLRRGRRLLPCANEETVYEALELPQIIPELREGGGEIGLAEMGRLPDPVAASELRGILHAHTDRSDGTHTLRQMAEAARKRGYAYLGVTDHSQSAGYAGGLRPEEIEAQHAEADRLNTEYRGEFRVLKGIESDIRPDGTLDYPDDVLARFDFVIASVHSQFRLDRRTQTARIIRAVSNPYTTILGHPTGRQLLRRDGYDVDLDAVLEACAANAVVVEINANPYRLELDWRWHRRALELGCMLSINPDAHSTTELDLVRFGVAIARKGGVPRERVLNCLDLAALRDLLTTREQARRTPAKAKPVRRAGPAPKRNGQCMRKSGSTGRRAAAK